jgi:flagellar biosynthetic protein FliR
VHFTDTEITSWVTRYIWPFFRIAALVGVAPIFGTHTVPARVKVIIAASLTIMIAPILPKMKYIDPLSFEGMMVAFHQVLIGIAIGFMVSLVFSALVVGGQIVAQLMGLGFASLNDPQNGVSVPVVGQFYTVLATLIFLIMNGHLVLVNLLFTSYQTLPIGDFGLSPDKLWQLVLWSRWIFIIAVIIALPSVTALLLVNIAFGVMTRAAPQLNIFAVGFPITILLGFVVMLASLSYFVPKLQQSFEHVFHFISATLIARV